MKGHKVMGINQLEEEEEEDEEEEERKERKEEGYISTLIAGIRGVKHLIQFL